MQNNVGIAIFTYHRYEHTKKVINALENNSIVPAKIYIFQDGINEKTDVEGWNKINELINSISWCETKVFVSENNKGLAKSIVSGINMVLSENDAVIVLEDDCVPNKYFLEYMYDAFEKYKDNKEVFTITGYRWETDLESDKYDAYFSGKFSSWGWGTWKDRWEKYTQDYTIIRRIKENKDSYERLMTWGQNLESMLIGNIDGSNNSWAVFMALMSIENGGLHLSPYKSLITNVGFDGSGTHSGKRIGTGDGREYSGNGKFILPEVSEPSDFCKSEFKALRSKITKEQKFQLNQKVLLDLLKNINDRKIIQIPFRKIAVWGKGPMCDALIRNLSKDISITCIIESTPSGVDYNGIPIVPLGALSNEIEAILVIPFYDIESINYKASKQNIKAEIIGFNRIVSEYMK